MDLHYSQARKRALVVFVVSVGCDVAVASVASVESAESVVFGKVGLGANEDVNAIESAFAHAIETDEKIKVELEFVLAFEEFGFEVKRVVEDELMSDNDFGCLLVN